MLVFYYSAGLFETVVDILVAVVAGLCVVIVFVILVLLVYYEVGRPLIGDLTVGAPIGVRIVVVVYYDKLSFRAVPVFRNA